MSLHGQRSRDKVVNVYSRTEERAREFAKEWDIPNWTTDMDEAIGDDDADVVLIALPNFLHKEAAIKSAAAGKAVLCTKPLAMNGREAKEILEAVEEAGVFHGYLEDLVYTPKTLKALKSVEEGTLGTVLWTRSREAHPGPHSDWFWDPEQSGGGAIIDIGCHCIEIGRNFIGKDIRPVEAMCWADTQVKPIEAEDNALGWVRYDNGAISQFEVSWTYRGGMDLRDEVNGTEGSLRLDHFLRTGFEMYTAGGQKGYVAEKTESGEGWLFSGTTTCSPTCSTPWRTGQRRANRFTTDTSSTRSWTPATVRPNRDSGSRLSSRYGAARKMRPAWNRSRSTTTGTT